MIRTAAAVLGLVAVSTAFAGSTALGPAADYNVYVLGAHTASNSDIEGRVAVGGAASYTNYAIGLAIGGAGTNGVFGTSLSFTNGTIYGAAAYGTSATIANANVTGGASQQSPINFTTTGTQLQSLSTQYGALATNGAAAQVYSSLTFTGTQTGLNVFQIASSAFSGISEIKVNAPAGATVLINVTGSSVNLPNIGHQFTGVTRNSVLYNMVNATGLTIQGSFNGSVLAPRAAVQTNYGDFNGQLVAGSLTGHLQFNQSPFTGQINVIPLPPAAAAGLAMLAGLAGFRAIRRR